MLVFTKLDNNQSKGEYVAFWSIAIEFVSTPGGRCCPAFSLSTDMETWISTPATILALHYWVLPICSVLAFFSKKFRIILRRKSSNELLWHQKFLRFFITEATKNSPPPKNCFSRVFSSHTYICKYSLLTAWPVGRYSWCFMPLFLFTIPLVWGKFSGDTFHTQNIGKSIMTRCNRFANNCSDFSNFASAVVPNIFIDLLISCSGHCQLPNFKSSVYFLKTSRN